MDRFSFSLNQITNIFPVTQANVSIQVEILTALTFLTQHYYMYFEKLREDRKLKKN